MYSIFLITIRAHAEYDSLDKSGVELDLDMYIVLYFVVHLKARRECHYVG